MPGATLAKVGHWLAGLGFWQFVGFSLLVLAAGAIVDAALFPDAPERVAVRTAAVPPRAASSPASSVEAPPAGGRAQEVRIGRDGIVVSDRGDPTQADDAPQAGSATHGPSPRLVQLLLAALAVLWVLRFIYRSRASAEARVGQAEATAEREALERKLAEARLQALQAQIEPHFLFNTLANVASLIDAAPDKARAMLERLIELLRASLASSRATRTRLEDELRLVRAYLDILALRMGPRLTYSIELEPGLAGCEVPPLLVQPLVENAIRHGLEPKLTGGRVEVVARVQSGQLEVTVSDDGLGFTPDARAGVGLANLRERLAALYGEAALLRIEDALPGTRVRVSLPLNPGSRA
jgi:two-component sensor histidine kinase